MVDVPLPKKFLAVSGHTKMGIEVEKLKMIEQGDIILLRLMALKSTERKDDPERRQDLYGPYEELVMQATGRLPEGYYEVGDDAPWGLLLHESRSNILWQVLSGMIDHRPEFAAAYMGLALDHSLSVDEYARELGKIHHNWRQYHATQNIFSNHRHQAMKDQYHAVSCPACSVLTSMVCQDPKMNELFQKLIPMTIDERKFFLEEQGFAPLLNVMIPDQLIYLENHI